MKRVRKAASYLRGTMIFLALVLPVLSLLPLGSLWLWERGYLLYWIGGALALSIISFLTQLWLVKSLKPSDTQPLNEPLASAEARGDTPREAAAWTAVELLAATADPAKLTSRDALLDLGLQTIEAVARSMHPLDKDPLWRFTVPEALALTERVTRQLRPFVVDNIPLGDQLTIGQVMKVYRWRSAIDVAEQAYDLWRVIRVLNPVTAVTSEARERLTKKLYSGLRDELASRLTQGYVREVGRAAIDLYGGRLRVSTEELNIHVSSETERDLSAAVIAEPIRILVAGQISAGKSSVINALSRQLNAAVDVVPATAGFTAYRLQRDELPPLLLIDSPGATTATIDRLAEEAGACDLIIWVTSVSRADRDVDRLAINAIRAHFAAKPDRRPPPIIGAITHVDQLRPQQDWAPPYDLTDQSNAKVRSIRAAIDTIAADINLPSDALVPVSLDDRRSIFNVDGLWQKLSIALPEARRAHLLRRTRGAATSWTWKKLWSQVKGGAGAATRAASGNTANRPKK